MKEPPTSNPPVGPIGLFDSGYGGLTIMKEIKRVLPSYDYLYLGDNARAPYGSRSFDLIYEFTLQAVEHLFAEGCRLVILACNTASAKALRSIQQQVLPVKYPGRRVLGVIRPTVETLGEISKSRHVALLATPGTVGSHSYRMEIEKLYPDMKVTEVECPMFVPLVEAGEADGDGADYFVRKYLDRTFSLDPQTDTLVLGCTHYPLLLPKIKRYAPEGVKIVTQGNIVAHSLADYLVRHPEIAAGCTGAATERFLTTENPEKFSTLASLFLGHPVEASRIIL